MKASAIAVSIMAAVFLFSTAGISFSAHEDVKGTVKGTVTEIKIVEVELTVKDDKGKETKVKTKDTGLKLGDRIVIKDGKASKEVKPITGGY